MKFHKLLVFMMVFSLAVFAKSTVFAQDDDDDMSNTTEMDEDQWQAQMDEYTAKKTDLTNQLASLTTEVDGLKKRLDDVGTSETNAKNSLYAMVGSEAEYNTYKQKFADAEKRVNACKGPDDATDIQKNMWPYLTDAGANGRMKCLSEFWDRYNSMKKKIADCMGKMPMTQEGYTVKKGDCLYKIAGMQNIYGNSRLWPAIWDANKNGVVNAPPKVKKTIPNPNLIYPGQVLRIPTLTDAQKMDAMRMSSSYKMKRKKRMMKSSNDMNKDKTEKKDMKDMKKPDTKDMKKPDTKKPDMKKDTTKTKKK